MVDTTVRRCTRSAAKNVGYRAQSLQELPNEPKKKKPRSKPMEVEPLLLAHQSSPQPATPQQDKQKHEVPTTAIKVMQAIGEELQVAPDLLTKDRHMANLQGGS